MAIDAATKYVLVVLLFFTYTYCVNGFPQFSIDPENPFNAGLNVLGHTRLRALEKISKTMIKESIKPTWHILCIACKFSAKSLQYLIRFGVKEDTLAFVASSFCKKFHVYSDRVCDGLGQMYKNEVFTVFSQVTLNSAEICSTVVDEDCGFSSNPKDNWTIALPDVPKPPVVPVTPPKEGSPILQVLQLSDIHYDPEYMMGSNANCGEPLCCRANSPNHTSGPPAGAWGDYRLCDTPLQTIENTLKHISNTHKVDYILWTGDDPPHNVWNQNKEQHIAVLTKVATLLQAYFPGIPVFPALGNHEGIPVNSFPPPFASSSMTWLYDTLSQLWTKWLPPQTNSTIRKGGFYSVQLFPGFRIISLNMNFCNDLNWWLLLNTTDPLDELQWLVEELTKAETRGEKVHIIGHIPPGTNDCLPTWSYNYDYIVNRFESTIRGQFFGHTHMDQFEVFYNRTESKKRPVSVAYLSPSITPYSMSNPSYRLYSIDGNYSNSSWAVLDHDTFYFDLSEANHRGAPLWEHLYNAKDMYNLTSLQPEEWDNLIAELDENDIIFQQFYRNYHRVSSAMPPCDKICKQKLLCGLRNARSHDNILCRNKVI